MLARTAFKARSYYRAQIQKFCDPEQHAVVHDISANKNINPFWWNPISVGRHISHLFLPTTRFHSIAAISCRIPATPLKEGARYELRHSPCKCRRNAALKYTEIAVDP